MPHNIKLKEWVHFLAWQLFEKGRFSSQVCSFLEHWTCAKPWKWFIWRRYVCHIATHTELYAWKSGNTCMLQVSFIYCQRFGTINKFCQLFNGHKQRLIMTSVGLQPSLLATPNTCGLCASAILFQSHLYLLKISSNWKILSTWKCTVKRDLIYFLNISHGCHKHHRPIGRPTLHGLHSE